MTFASRTKVPVSKTRQEIEQTLLRYGAKAFGFMKTEDRAMVGFELQDRHIKIYLPLAGDGQETGDSAEAKENRRRWRCLLLVLKAKLEAVESEISTFENEFLANIVMPGGETVGEHTAPLIEQAYLTGRVPALLPDYTGG